MLVTVVVPTYQRAYTLGECLDSLLGQDYEALEVLVVDDGSTDGTQALLAQYAADHPVRLRWVRQENAGQPAALNRGFELGRGSILGTLSSDDVLLPGAIRAIVEPLLADPLLDGSFPDNYCIDAAGKVTDTITYDDFDVVASIRDHDCPIGVGALFRRSLLDRIGPWNTGYRFCPDLEFLFRAGLSGARFHHIPIPLGSWRIHDDGLSTTRSLEAARERLRLVEEIYQRSDMPAEIRAVQGAAYRSALITAAVIAAPEDGATQRFSIIDCRTRTLLATATEEYAAQLTSLQVALLGAQEAAQQAVAAHEELHAETVWLHEEVAKRDADITWLHAEVAKRDAEIALKPRAPDEAGVALRSGAVPP